MKTKWNQLIAKDHKSSRNYLPSNFNYSLYLEFVKFIKKNNRILFIFSEYDKFWMEFKEHFKEKLLPFNSELDNNYQIHEIPKANHNLALKEWQDEAFGSIIAFIE